MAELTIVINSETGEAVVTADGSKASCDAATAVEKAMGKTTKSVPTGVKPVTNKVTQR